MGMIKLLVSSKGDKMPCSINHVTLGIRPGNGTSCPALRAGRMRMWMLNMSNKETTTYQRLEKERSRQKE